MTKGVKRWALPGASGRSVIFPLREWSSRPWQYMTNYSPDRAPLSSMFRIQIKVECGI
jgi:hypothetical protein